MNRAERLRRVAPGLPDELVATLAARPAAEVGVIVAALRQARRDERDHLAARRRQRKADARAHSHYSPGQLADRNLRLLTSTARRGNGNLDALAALAGFARHLDDVTALAVDGLRARGYSDAVIAPYLGVTRQAVWQRFPRTPAAG